MLFKMLLWGNLLFLIFSAKTKFKVRPQLIVCVIEKGQNWLYEKIKQVCLCQAGIVSQVMLAQHLTYEIKDQYIANVALKANIKIGGASNYVDVKLTEKTTMFVGIDVSFYSDLHIR